MKDRGVGSHALDLDDLRLEGGAQVVDDPAVHAESGEQVKRREGEADEEARSTGRGRESKRRRTCDACCEEQRIEGVDDRDAVPGESSAPKRREELSAVGREAVKERVGQETVRELEP